MKVAAYRNKFFCKNQESDKYIARTVAALKGNNNMTSTSPSLDAVNQSTLDTQLNIEGKAPRTKAEKLARCKQIAQIVKDEKLDIKMLDEALMKLYII
ncbi:hypothetical protein [Variovorax sp. LG9.2]|uniref:hypothetical protein n=1 Tax=Variovorax sp. LG9.2 TaxID=3048626 RepID=UPI002B22E625|nr:hypothetical protein [Variovorax sp. LG9.2]MEB0057300.1 hypothetical protein [Variovorax sp. LG9.2]